MPYVNIKITREGQVTPEQKARLIKGVTDLLADVLHKNPATTVVVIDEVPLKTGASAAIPSWWPGKRGKNKRGPRVRRPLGAEGS